MTTVFYYGGTLCRFRASSVSSMLLRSLLPSNSPKLSGLASTHGTLRISDSEDDDADKWKLNGPRALSFVQLRCIALLRLSSAPATLLSLSRDDRRPTLSPSQGSLASPIPRRLVFSQPCRLPSVALALPWRRLGCRSPWKRSGGLINCHVPLIGRTREGAHSRCSIQPTGARSGMDL